MKAEGLWHIARGSPVAGPRAVVSHDLDFAVSEWDNNLGDS